MGRCGSALRSSKPELHTGMGFLHLGPRVKASPQPPSTSPKRKRDLTSDSDDDLAELLDPEPVWSVETLCGLKMKLKKQRMSIVRPEYHKVFVKLLGKRRPHSSLLKQKRELAVNPLPCGKAAPTTLPSVILEDLCSVDSQGHRWQDLRLELM